MINKLDTRFAAMAAFLAASVASGAAFAVVEIEDNNTIATAQRLVISGGSVEVNAILGNGSLGVNDVDFFSFAAKAGDVVTLDIDGGMKADGSGVDTTIAIFTPDSRILIANDDGGIFDLGSVFPSGNLDSYIPNQPLPVTGIYTVGVSNSSHVFLDGGGLGSSGFSTNNTNGSYTLIISGVSDTTVQAAPPPPPPPAPVVQQINIEIKPGSRDLAPPINPKSQGSIPVALLSNPGFDPRGVDTSSLTFGHSGNEAS